jgi:hypothetical protein
MWSHDDLLVEACKVDENIAELLLMNGACNVNEAYVEACRVTNNHKNIEVLEKYGANSCNNAFIAACKTQTARTSMRRCYVPCAKQTDTREKIQKTLGRRAKNEQNGHEYQMFSQWQGDEKPGDR